MSDESKEDRIERLKKQMKDAPSGRPMGYIYPKRIQSIMHGETPVINVGYEGNKKKETRKVGDKWIDDEGKEWEQKEGYTISVPKYIEESRVPNECPKCKKSMYDKEYKLNSKFYWLRGHCFDCHIKFEENIRIMGHEAWSKYEQGIMIRNIMSFLKDAKKEIDEFLPTLSSKMTYVTEDGHLEKWEGDVSATKEFLEKELKSIEDDLSYLERDLKELESES